VDETYVRVKGKWVYLYRAVDSDGATIDFLPSAKRDAAAAERFLAKALGGANHPAPRVINTDEHAGYPPAIRAAQSRGCSGGELPASTGAVPGTVFWNRITGPSNAWCVQASIFRSFWGPWRTIAGYEAIHTIQRPSVLECGGSGRVTSRWSTFTRKVY
jgi:IS6 family transposase